MSSPGSAASSPGSRRGKRNRVEDDDPSVDKTPSKKGRKASQQSGTPSRRSARGAAGASETRTRKRVFRQGFG